jgi:hypothetical protein
MKERKKERKKERGKCSILSLAWLDIRKKDLRGMSDQEDCIANQIASDNNSNNIHSSNNNNNNNSNDNNEWKKRENHNPSSFV